MFQWVKSHCLRNNGSLLVAMQASFINIKSFHLRIKDEWNMDYAVSSWLILKISSWFYDFTVKCTSHEKLQLEQNKTKQNQTRMGKGEKKSILLADWRTFLDNPNHEQLVVGYLHIFSAGYHMDAPHYFSSGKVKLWWCQVETTFEKILHSTVTSDWEFRHDEGKERSESTTK